MRRKSWLRQASRDRRPRRTQSSISPSYERNTQCDEGGRGRWEDDRGWDGQKVKYNKCDQDERWKREVSWEEDKRDVN